MSDQIFKAWDNKNKCWLKRFSIDADGSIQTWDEIESWFENGIAYNKCTFYSVDATLCRSTLFKDKNDKVIWQGDIIMVNGKKDLIRQIIWDEETCSIMMQPIPRQPWIYDLQPLKKEWIEYINRDIEIIGNIFENLKLLKEKVLKSKKLSSF